MSARQTERGQNRQRQGAGRDRREADGLSEVRHGIPERNKRKDTVIKGSRLSLSDTFKIILRSEKIQMQTEYRFHPTRKWRFDYADPENKIAVEIDGGAFIQGRHTRGLGFIKDQDKCNAAVVLGWRVFRYSTVKQMADFPKDRKGLL